MVLRVLPCALCVAALGCGSDVIEHAEPTADSLPGDPGATTGLASFDEVTAGSSPGEGNFPEPALTRCGELGENTYPIETLRSAWGVVAVGGTQGDDGEVEPNTIRLRLTDEALFDCQDPLAVSGWAFALTLAPHEAVVGVHEIDSLFAPELELVHGGDSFSSPITGALELVRVTQDCVVGVVSNLAIGGELAPDLDGGFAAELCARTCLPTADHDC